MIHIVFNTADIDVLREAMKQDESLSGDIFEIKDDFAVGPLEHLDTEEGWQSRVAWWRELLKDSPYGEATAGSFDDRDTVKAIAACLNENPDAEAWIWMGQNQHDVTGYFWLMPQLREFQGRLMILYLNNLPFINEKGQIFYPWGISEVLPREILKARKLARPVTLSEFEVDPDEWKRLVNENAAVRILEGGKKIVGREVNFYDAEILKNITGEWQKAWRVLSNTQNRMKIKTGDVFLIWRLRQLVALGRIVGNGEGARGWKDFEVKLQEARQLELTEQS